MFQKVKLAEISYTVIYCYTAEWNLNYIVYNITQISGPQKSTYFLQLFTFIL